MKVSSSSSSFYLILHVCRHSHSVVVNFSNSFCVHIPHATVTHCVTSEIIANNEQKYRLRPQLLCHRIFVFSSHSYLFNDFCQPKKKLPQLFSGITKTFISLEWFSLCPVHFFSACAFWADLHSKNVVTSCMVVPNKIIIIHKWRVHWH